MELTTNRYQVGQRLRHPQFGDGLVVEVHTDRGREVLEVVFDGHLRRLSAQRDWELVDGASADPRHAPAPAVVPDAGAIAPVGSTAATTADQIAWSTSQVAAITADPNFRGGDYYAAADGDGPHVGMGIARMIAHTTYRSESELAERFGRNYQGNGDPLGKGGQFAVQSYLAHHARKLARRFDANTYIRLAQAILGLAPETRVTVGPPPERIGEDDMLAGSLGVTAVVLRGAGVVGVATARKDLPDTEPRPFTPAVPIPFAVLAARAKERPPARPLQIDEALA